MLLNVTAHLTYLDIATWSAALLTWALPCRLDVGAVSTWTVRRALRVSSACYIIREPSSNAAYPLLTCRNHISSPYIQAYIFYGRRIAQHNPGNTYGETDIAAIRCHW